MRRKVIGKENEKEKYKVQTKQNKMSSYQQLEIDEFPSSPVNWKQLLFLRTWEGVGLTTVFYYVAMIVELFVTLLYVNFSSPLPQPLSRALYLS